MIYTGMVLAYAIMFYGGMVLFPVFRGMAYPLNSSSLLPISLV